MKKLILIFSFMPFLAFTQQKDYRAYDKAVTYNNKGNIEKAVKYANKALEENPDWSKPNLLLASIYIKNNEIKRAADYLLKVYDEKNSKDIIGIEQVAQLYYTHGYYVNALYYFSIVTGLDPMKTKEYWLILENCRFAVIAMKNPVDFNTRNIGQSVNSSMSEHVNAITVTGEELFFTRKIESNKKLDQEDLFVFNTLNNSVNPLPFNTSKNEGAITVSADGSMYVYTACDRVNSIGGCDLYIRQYCKKNGWLKEYNLGENVNSNKWESQASFSADGKYLYFISNRPGGFGKEDIWRSEITKEGFMPAENLGSRINTSQIEMSPFLHPDNLTLYFASDGHIGMGDDDLFVSRRLNTQERWGVPENLGYPINTHNSQNSLIVARNGKTAYYTSDVSGFGKEDIFQFDLPESLQADSLEELELEIITQKIGEEIVLKNVSFSSNSYELEKTSFFELDELIAYLQKSPNLQIEIQGHTDDVGSESDNQILSEKRAKVVFNYLSDKVENTLSYRGFGELRPLTKNASANGRMINRRTSFVIIQ